MNQRSISTAVITLLAIAGMAGGALPVMAGSSGNGTAGSGFPQYTFENDATRLCKSDVVVWGSSANRGIYFVKGAGPYSAAGKRVGGFYACEADVKKAGYKIE